MLHASVSTAPCFTWMSRSFDSSLTVRIVPMSSPRAMSRSRAMGLAMGYRSPSIKRTTHTVRDPTCRA